jgi:hypothetical protein
MVGRVNRRIVLQVGLGKKQDTISKITREKKVGGMAQGVELLPHKHEALSLGPVPPKTKQNKTKA